MGGYGWWWLVVDGGGKCWLVVGCDGCCLVVVGGGLSWIVVVVVGVGWWWWWVVVDSLLVVGSGWWLWVVVVSRVVPHLRGECPVILPWKGLALPRQRSSRTLKTLSNCKGFYSVFFAVERFLYLRDFFYYFD